MKRIILSATALALLSGIALAAPAEAALLTSHERAALARNHAHVRALERQARADGHVSLWERVKINFAQARHRAMASRFRHN
jgi:hypothetical protein